MILSLRESSPTLLGAIVILALAWRPFGPGRSLAALNTVAAWTVAILLRKSRSGQWLHMRSRRRRIIQLRRFSWFWDWQLRNGSFRCGSFRLLHTGGWNDGCFDSVGDWLS